MVLKLGNKMRVIPLRECDRPRCVSIWQLANDVEAYGQQAGHFILTTPNGENELAGVFSTEEAADDYAIDQGWQIVPLDIL